jgi:hypothetical protein
MSNKLLGYWQPSMDGVRGISYICGYCGSDVGPANRYKCVSTNSNKSHVNTGNIYLCPRCNKPTFIGENGEQAPGPIIGGKIDHLPNDIEQLYDEARKCVSIGAYTSSILACRKLLMNISVSKGAEAGKAFAFYVTFLEESHFIPPGSRDWVDHIRKKGNEATHEIPSITTDDAIELLEFTEMLLRFVYELPGKMTRHRITVD